MCRDLTSRQRPALLALFCVALVLVADAACVKLPRRARAESSSVSASPAQQTTTLGNKPAPARPVDINRAAPEELARLPGVGEGLAARIVEHRARYGAFRRAEHLLMVRGIGERRFERLRPYITVE